MEILFFAALAGFVLFRLYKVLGQDVGFKPGEVLEPEEQMPVSRTFANKQKPSDELASHVQDIQKVDPSFNPTSFIEGATSAFEMILHALNTGDLATLASLLDPELYPVFENAIAMRDKKKEVWDNTLIRVQSADIIEARIEKKTQVFIGVKFVSDQILVTHDAAGKVIEGDPDQIEVITDIWTFTRNATSKNPNWALIQTASHE